MTIIALIALLVLALIGARVRSIRSLPESSATAEIPEPKPVAGWTQDEAGMNYHSAALMIQLVRSGDNLILYCVFNEPFERAPRMVYIYPVREGEAPLAFPVRTLSPESFVSDLDQKNLTLRKTLKGHEEGIAWIMQTGSKSLLISPRGFIASSFVSDQ
jgi:hypothetical protein